MAFKHSIVAALMLAGLVCSSRLSESARKDQYRAREDGPHTPQLLSEATDHHVIVHKPQHAAAPLDTSLNFKLQKSRTRKRSTSSWSPYQIPQFEYPSSLTVFKHHYPLGRPYFIPTFGVSGRLQMYFPPQPFLINPGTPIDNPKKVFQGPPYLPPKPDDDDSSTTMPIIDRCCMDDDDDDRPVWDNNPVVERPAPPMHLANNGDSDVRPTRKPRPPGRTTTHPPLVHNVNSTSSSRPSAGAGFVPTRPSPGRTTTSPPPLQRPTTSPPRPPQDDAPTTCEWAIVFCCSATTAVVQPGCFEQRGCPGPFWGASPCQSDFARAAIQKALNYYNTN